MNAIIPSFGCTVGGLPFEDALARVLALAGQWPAAELVVVAACAGRTLATPVTARISLPGFHQSAMDGYAVYAADLTPGAWLPVTGRTAAGEAPGILPVGGAHRILAGAPLPAGSDAVIPQEYVISQDDMIQIAAVPPPGANIRRHGEDIRAGQALIPAGMVLDWRHVTVLASQGIEQVAVRRRPRVVLLSSGRELRAPGQDLAPGQIHDTNMPMLLALLHGWGADVRPQPVVPDNADAMWSALADAAADADLVLTTAGISVGDEDHVRDALAGLGGDLAVFKVAMKPGKPLAAGRLGRAAFIGLPGNPQAALAGAVGFVRPLLARMTGSEAPQPVAARAGFTLRRKPGRADFIPVRLVARDGCLRAERAGPDGPGRLSPLLAATGFAFLRQDAADIGEGDLLPVLPFVAGGLAQ
jgi:molybdopterin molybdotransferase